MEEIGMLKMTAATEGVLQTLLAKLAKDIAKTAMIALIHLGNLASTIIA